MFDLEVIETLIFVEAKQTNQERFKAKDQLWSCDGIVKETWNWSEKVDHLA